MTRRARKRLLVSVAMALVIGTLLTAAYERTYLSTAQVRSTDFLFKTRAVERARSTVIIGIDQRSYDELTSQYGHFPEWPRSLYARVVDRLHRAGARVIVFDLFFDDSHADDPTLTASIKRAGKVLMPVEARGPKQLAPRPGVAQAFDVFARPPPKIASSAAAEGFVNVTMDSDSIVRGLPLLLDDGHEEIPALALATVAQYVRRRTVLDAPPTDGIILAAGRAIPVTTERSLTINFLGPPSDVDRPGSFTIIPFLDVLNGTFDAALVEDKIALLGLTIRDRDEHAAPTTTETRMWGVEVLGNAVETILNQRYVVPISRRLTVGAIFFMALASGLLAATVRPVIAACLALGLLAVYFILAGILFDGGTVVNLVFPPSALLLAFVAALIYRVVFEQAEQEAIRGAMGRYLSPTVSRWLLEDPDRLRLGGESRDMTVLFCDLRGFTTVSQSLDPQVLVPLLNEFMTAMTEVVFAHEGVLDKYIGDAIMAFWGAPMDQRDHARRACAAALDMIAQLRALQAEWIRRDLPALEVGIGLNTGSMVVGNMGSRKRLAYTVLGDAVNVASRLEGLSKEFHVRIVISEATRQAAGDAFTSRFLGSVMVKGRSEPVSVYELVGSAR